MDSRKTMILLGSIGFCLYRSGASFLYDTGMGMVGRGVGFISSLQFVYILNIASCVTAVALFFASRAGKLGNLRLKQWPAILAMAIGVLPAIIDQTIWGESIFGIACLLAPILCGFALMVLCAVWLEVFILQDNIGGVLAQIVIGYTLYTITFTLFPLLPLMTGSIAAVLVVIASAFMLQAMRKRLGDVERPHLAVPTEESATMMSTFLCFFVLVGVVGIMHTSVLGSSSEGIISAVPLWAIRLAALLVFLLIVYLMGQHVNAGTVFRICFPVLICILSAMPFLSETLGPLSGAIAMACYMLCGMVFFLYLVREGRRLQLAPYRLASLYMVGSNVFLLIGLSIGLGLQALSASFGYSLVTLLAFVAIYPLALILIFASKRDRAGAARQDGARHKTDDRRGTDTSHEADTSFATDGSLDAAGPRATDGENTVDQPARTVDFDAAIVSLASRYGLSRREREVLEYLAKGRSVRYIAETLFISENTAWSHTKRIYGKLGIHTKQEVMDLVDKECGTPEA